MTKACYSDPKKFHTSKAGRHRAKLQLSAHPTCLWCEQEGHTVQATVAHHIEPFGDSWFLFMTIPLISLCVPHHNRTAQQHERGRQPQEIDADGYVVSKQNPGGAVRKKKTGT